MNARKRLNEHTVAELRAKAEECRHMAASATTVATRDALLKLADRFADLAASRGPDAASC
jgi:hypothetical protein